MSPTQHGRAAGRASAAPPAFATSGSMVDGGSAGTAASSAKGAAKAPKGAKPGRKPGPGKAAASAAAAAASAGAGTGSVSSGEHSGANDDTLCGLCYAGYKLGDKWRKVRYIHIHWYMLMESGALCHPDGKPMHMLSEWTDKDPFKRWAKDKGQRVSSHFKCFPHSALAHCFESCSTEVLVHKHCLHAFNFVVKARFDDLVAATGYVPGPHPDDFGSVYAKKDLEAALVFNPAKPELYVRDPAVISHAGARAAYRT